MGLNSAKGAVVPLVGRHLAKMLPDAAESQLLDQKPSIFGVMPWSEPGHKHHLSKRAPARYRGYNRGYSRGYRGRGGRGNRGRNAVSVISSPDC